MQILLRLSFLLRISSANITFGGFVSSSLQTAVQSAFASWCLHITSSCERHMFSSRQEQRCEKRRYRLPAVAAHITGLAGGWGGGLTINYRSCALCLLVLSSSCGFSPGGKRKSFMAACLPACLGERRAPLPFISTEIRWGSNRKSGCIVYIAPITFPSINFGLQR